MGPPFGEKQTGPLWMVVLVPVVPEVGRCPLLEAFFSRIHGYSGGSEAVGSGLHPSGLSLGRPWRGWLPGLRLGMVCSKGGGMSVGRGSVELLIDELWKGSATGGKDVRHSASDGWLLMNPLSRSNS